MSDQFAEDVLENVESDEEKLQVASKIVNSVDEVNAEVVASDPDLLSTEEIAEATDIIEEYKNKFQSTGEEFGDEDFKYYDQLQIFYRQVEDAIKKYPVSLEEKRQMIVGYILIGEEVFENFAQYETRMRGHFKNNGVGKISDWISKHGYHSPQSARNRGTNAKYKWEAIARAWEYVKKRCDDVVSNCKQEVVSKAEEYKRRGIAQFVEDCNNISSGIHIIEVLENNTDLVNLEDQPGIFWAWGKMVNTESVSGVRREYATKLVQGACKSLQDIKPATWKFFVKMSRGSIDELMDFSRTGLNPIEFQVLRNMKEAGLDGDEEIVEKILTHIDISGYFQLGEQSPVAVFRACANAWKSSDNKEVTWREEIQPILDWVGAEMPVLDENQQTAPFEWFIRQKDEWHEEGGGNEYGRGDDFEWGTLIDSLPVRDYVAVALTTTEELNTEGSVMGHCVNRYTRYCVRSNARIFSIRSDKDDPESSVATVELRMKNGVWSVNQVRGPSNSDVSDDILAETEILKSEYNKAWDNATERERLESLNQSKV